MYRTMTWCIHGKICKKYKNPVIRIGVTKIQKQVNMLNRKGKRMFMYEMC
jgi:hypothetical protein